MANDGCQFLVDKPVADVIGLELLTNRNQYILGKCREGCIHIIVLGVSLDCLGHS